jgi:hypothetical protein
LYQAMPSVIAQVLHYQSRLNSLLKNSPIAD